MTDPKPLERKHVARLLFGPSATWDNVEQIAEFLSIEVPDDWRGLSDAISGSHITAAEQDEAHEYWKKYGAKKKQKPTEEETRLASAADEILDAVDEFDFHMDVESPRSSEVWKELESLEKSCDALQKSIDNLSTMAKSFLNPPNLPKSNEYIYEKNHNWIRDYFENDVYDRGGYGVLLVLREQIDAIRRAKKCIREHWRNDPQNPNKPYLGGRPANALKEAGPNLIHRLGEIFSRFKSYDWPSKEAWDRDCENFRQSPEGEGGDRLEKCLGDTKVEFVEYVLSAFVDDPMNGVDSRRILSEEFIPTF